MNLRQKQNIMVGAMYTAFGWFWLLQIYYYIRWGFLLREQERVTGPVEHNAAGGGPVDVDPLDPRRWNNRVFRTFYTIQFANNMVLIAMALEYAPYNFEIVAAWLWLGFMLIYLVFYPFQRCMVLYKFADIGMHTMNIALIISGLVEVGHHKI